MKLIKVISIGTTLVVISLATACGNSEQSSNTTNTSSQAADTNIAPSSTTLPRSPPSATMKAWCDAQKRKDVEGWKKALSQYDLNEAEESAKRANESLNAHIKALYFDNKIMSGMGPCEGLVTRNEQITGDKATLDAQNAMGRTMTYHFVIENGEWKISSKDKPELTQEERDRRDQQILDDSEAIRKKKGIK